MSIFRSLGVPSTPTYPRQPPHKLAPHSTRCVFIGYSLDHKGYHCLDLSTNRVVISQHITFDEGCFTFVASPTVTNDYEFLSEMDQVLSPIRTCHSAGIPTTTSGGLTVPLGSLTAWPTGGPPLTPSGGLTARIAKAGG
jgi:hypothetical protein